MDIDDKVMTHEDFKILPELRNKPVFAPPTKEQEERYIAKMLKRLRESERA